MRTGLYCYWGAVGDHNLNLPGHPLYQLYCLEALADFFKLDKIYFYSFLRHSVESSAEDVKFFVFDRERHEIVRDLNLEVVTLGGALEQLQTADVVFLKARFRNKSRLEERSYDALKFETLLRKSDPEKTYIIDSDGELPIDFFRTTDAHLLTFFYEHEFYAQYDPMPTSIQTIVPALVKRAKADEIRTLDQRPTDLFFIGNEGLKQPKLASWLDQLAADGLRVIAHGKWKSRHPFDVLARTQRKEAYERFPMSLATLQISKEKYRQFTFLSPRIYEAVIAGVVPMIELGYSCAAPFNSVDSYIDLREKLRTLRDGYNRDFAAVQKDQLLKLARIEAELRQHVHQHLRLPTEPASRQRRT